MYTKESYETEMLPDADLVAKLFSRTLRSLPLEGNMKQKLTQTTLNRHIKRESQLSQRIILSKINKQSLSLWGSY